MKSKNNRNSAVPSNDNDKNHVYQFNMMSCIITMSLTSSIVGWLFTNFIPLFPNWLGSIIISIICSYSITLLNSYGDLLRYLSYNIYQFIFIINTTLNDVNLKEKVNVLFFKCIQLFKYMDSKYNIIDKIQIIFDILIKEIMKIIRRYYKK